MTPQDDFAPKSPLGATHLHYKGGYYRFVGVGVHSETLEDVVWYEHLGPHERGMWCRPAHLFFGLLPDGTPRFRRIVR
jgi:hypothetical protein